MPAYGTYRWNGHWLRCRSAVSLDYFYADRPIATGRLFALLDEAPIHWPGICVVDPPDAGKTTLVVSWSGTHCIGGKGIFNLVGVTDRVSWDDIEWDWETP